MSIQSKSELLSFVPEEHRAAAEAYLESYGKQEREAGGNSNGYALRKANEAAEKAQREADRLIGEVNTLRGQLDAAGVDGSKLQQLNDSLAQKDAEIKRLDAFRVLEEGRQLDGLVAAKLRALAGEEREFSGDHFVSDAIRKAGIAAPVATVSDDGTTTYALAEAHDAALEQYAEKFKESLFAPKTPAPPAGGPPPMGAPPARQGGPLDPDVKASIDAIRQSDPAHAQRLEAAMRARGLA